MKHRRHTTKQRQRTITSVEPADDTNPNPQRRAASQDQKHIPLTDETNFREANDTWVVFYKGIGDARG
jgi:hypothetical protein